MYAKTVPQTKKKGTLGSNLLVGSALGLIVLVIVVSVSSQILGEIRDTQTVDSYQYNVTTSGLTAMVTYSDWFGILVIVTIAVVIIAILVSGFGRSLLGGGRGGA